MKKFEDGETSSFSISGNTNPLRYVLVPRVPSRLVVLALRGFGFYEAPPDYHVPTSCEFVLRQQRITF